MLLWVAPTIWKICSILGDLMMLTGLLMLLLVFCLLAYRGTEALIEKGEHHED